MFSIMLVQGVPEEIDLPRSLSPSLAAFRKRAWGYVWGSFTKCAIVSEWRPSSTLNHPPMNKGHTTSIPDPLQGGESLLFFLRILGLRRNDEWPVMTYSVALVALITVLPLTKPQCTELNGAKNLHPVLNLSRAKCSLTQDYSENARLQFWTHLAASTSLGKKHIIILADLLILVCFSVGSNVLRSEA